MPFARGRLLTGLALAATVACGLGSRRYPGLLPTVVTTYAGDTLWALAAFLSIKLIWPTLATNRAACAALLVSLLVELSQLYHPPWLDAIRSFRFAKLILGSGFLWSDLVCYAVGVAIGVVLDVGRNRLRANAGK